MTWLTRVADYFGLRDDDATPPAGVIPPARQPVAATPTTALTLGSVFRAVFIIAVAAKQLGVGVWRADQEIEAPSIIKKPNLDTHFAAFIEETTTSLALTGNAFWLKDTANSQVVQLTVLPAAEVAVMQDPRTKRITYGYDGKTYTDAQIEHLKLIRIPGALYGLGPIGAAAAELQGALDLRDYAANWFRESATPNGLLTTDQPLNRDQAREYKQQAKESFSGHGLAVLGSGLKYAPTAIRPADAQFLESRQFSKTEIATMFGIPAKYMLAAVEGSSGTYSNQEQEDIAFVRYTLMGYLREIEMALTGIVPRGQDVRFKIDALLRTDTKTRFETYKIGLDAGIYDTAYVQQLEGLPHTTAKPAHTTTEVPAND